jgi:type I restriction enzyme, S subunit
LNQANLNRIPIPRRSPEEQERIVTLLDRLEELSTGLATVLGEERTARRQQYVYYRERLLTFEEAPE